MGYTRIYLSLVFLPFVPSKCLSTTPLKAIPTKINSKGWALKSKDIVSVFIISDGW